MPLSLLFAGLLLAGLLLPGQGPARRAAAGMAGFLLGWGSLRVGLPGADWTVGLSDVLAQPEASGYLVVNLGLLLLGPITLLVAGWQTWRSGVAAARVRAGVAIALGVAVLLALAPAIPVLRPAPPLLIAGAFGGAGITAIYGARVLGWSARVRRLDERLPGVTGALGPAGGWRRRDGVLALALAAAAATALLGTGPVVSASAIVLGTVTVDLVGMRLAGRRRFPFATLAGTIVLAVAWWASGPLEAAWEFTLTGFLLLAVWVIAALWPWHRWAPTAVGAPLAAIALAEIGVGAFPGGVIFWQPVIFPVCVLSAWWAVAIGRGDLLTAALGLAAVSSGERFGLIGAALLLVAGVLLWVDPVRGRGRLLPAPAWVAVALAWTGMAVALPALLRAEVVYTVLLVGAAAVGVAAPAAILEEGPTAPPST